MKQISLSNTDQVVAVVDDEDYERISRHRWLISPKGYIVRYEGASYARVQYWMHNEVLGCPSNSGVDHKDRQKWNNTKDNLRIVSSSANQQNRVDTRNTSGFKGVTYVKARGKYRANIGVRGSLINLGSFLTAQEAADAYDKKAVELYGPGALTNNKLRGGQTN